MFVFAQLGCTDKEIFFCTSSHKSTACFWSSAASLHWTPSLIVVSYNVRSTLSCATFWLYDPTLILLKLFLSCQTRKAPVSLLPQKRAKYHLLECKFAWVMQRSILTASYTLSLHHCESTNALVCCATADSCDYFYLIVISKFGEMPLCLLLLPKISRHYWRDQGTISTLSNCEHINKTEYWLVSIANNGLNKAFQKYCYEAHGCFIFWSCRISSSSI